VAALCGSFASHDEAAEAVGAVLEVGIPGAEVRVLTGEPRRDAREEPMGDFAGSTEPGEPVGDFAGQHAEGHERGHFAGGARRGGSFADADRDQVISYPGGVEHAHIASHREIERLLTEAGLDEATAKRDLEAVHAGRVLVLVEAPEGETGRVSQALGA
jgi:hypothetical protein